MNPTPDDPQQNAEHGLQVSTDCFSDALVHPHPPHLPHTLRAGPPYSGGDWGDVMAAIIEVDGEGRREWEKRSAGENDDDLEE